MRRSLVSIIIAFLGLIGLSACGKLDTIPFEPTITPEEWLKIQPFAEFRLGEIRIILIQPSTSGLVYLLGLLAISIGIFLIMIRADHRSRLWWGIALALWGVGALLAGTSYEAFSYAIKCAGREICLWTSWWEIGYLLISVFSIDAMIVATAWCSTVEKARRALVWYGFLNALIYLIAILIGVFLPVKFLISFEFLLIISLPGILVLFAINLGRYLKLRLKNDLYLVGAWVWLGITITAYFLYYISGLTQLLWASGTWFSENDVLHIGLILWMLYLGLLVAPKLKDIPVAI